MTEEEIKAMLRRVLQNQEALACALIESQRASLSNLESRLLPILAPGAKPADVPKTAAHGNGSDAVGQDEEIGELPAQGIPIATIMHSSTEAQRDKAAAAGGSQFGSKGRKFSNSDAPIASMAKSIILGMPAKHRKALVIIANGNGATDRKSVARELGVTEVTFSTRYLYMLGNLGLLTYNMKEAKHGGVDIKLTPAGEHTVTGIKLLGKYSEFFDKMEKKGVRDAGERVLRFVAGAKGTTTRRIADELKSKDAPSETIKTLMAAGLVKFGHRVRGGKKVLITDEGAKAVETLNEIESKLSELKLSESMSIKRNELALLSVLKEHPLSSKKVAKVLDVTQSRAVAVLNTLIAKDFVEKRGNPIKPAYVITERGKRVLHAAEDVSASQAPNGTISVQVPLAPAVGEKPVHRDSFRELIAGLTDVQKNILVMLCAGGQMTMHEMAAPFEHLDEKEVESAVWGLSGKQLVRNNQLDGTQDSKNKDTVRFYPTPNGIIAAGIVRATSPMPLLRVRDPALTKVATVR